MDFSPERPAFFVNPEYRAMTGRQRPVIDPATLETVGAIAAAEDAEIDAALSAAAKAQAAWKRLDAKSRARHLHAVANAIEAADFTFCAELMVREMGKPYPEAIGEIANCAPIF
ncbi:MAG: aldehyde dehydrogenase, partial [Alphaproteobacteria bacterium]|nr:aldehyde dehydrogenase [Alphaproteobacteria bacterium]